MTRRMLLIFDTDTFLSAEVAVRLQAIKAKLEAPPPVRRYQIVAQSLVVDDVIVFATGKRKAQWKTERKGRKP